MQLDDWVMWTDILALCVPNHNRVERWIRRIKCVWVYFSLESLYGNIWIKIYHDQYHAINFEGSFVKLRKAIINSVMSVYPYGTTHLPLGRFSLHLIFEYFSEICLEYSSFIKTGQEEWVLYMKTNIHFWSYLALLCLEWKMFQTNVVEISETHIICSVTFSFKCYHLWDKVE